MLNRVEAIWTRAPRQLLAALVFWNARRHGHSGHGDLVPLLSTPQELGAVRSLPYTPCSRLPFLLFCRHTALRAAEGLSHGPLRLVPGPLHGLWAASLAFQRPPSPRKRQTWAPGLSYHRDRRHRHQHCHLRHKRPFSVSPLDLCASCSFLLELFFFFPLRNPRGSLPFLLRPLLKRCLLLGASPRPPPIFLILLYYASSCL